MDWKLEYELTRKNIVSSIESLRTTLTAQENFLKILDRNYNERKEIEALKIEKHFLSNIRGSIRIYPEDLNNYINQC